MHKRSHFQAVSSPFKKPASNLIQAQPDGPVWWRFAIFSGPSRAALRVASRRDASRCQPDLARRPRDVARIRERRRRRDAAGKGASAALCSRWEFRSHVSQRFVSRRRCRAVVRETTRPTTHAQVHTQVYTYTFCCTHMYARTQTHTHTRTRAPPRLQSRARCQAGHETLPDRLP